MQIQSTAEFETKVIKNPKPVLVDFFAQWCGPCKRLAPVLEELSQEMQDKLDIFKIDVDQVPELAERYNVSSIPALIIFERGQEIASQIGAFSKSDLQKWLKVKVKALA